jgi:ferredoxin
MAAERRLMVDWPACKGHGLCAELVPELVTLDEWGYPILADRPVTRGVQGHAQRAVAACPTLALVLVEQTNQSTPGAPPNPAADDPISGAIRAVTGANPVQRRPERPQTSPLTAPTAPVIPAAPAARSRRSQRSAPTGSFQRPQVPPPTAPVIPAAPAARSRRSERSAPTGSFQRPQIPEPTNYPVDYRDRTGSQRRPEPEDDPITGAIRAVTGPNAAPRGTPPTGMARHATPAYGQSALVPNAEPYEPGEGFFDGHAPRDAYEQQPTSRRRGRQEEPPPKPQEPATPHQPRTRREAKAAQGRRR